MRRLPIGVRDARVALGVVVCMLLAGFVLPLMSPEPESTSTFAAGAPGDEAVPGEGSARGVAGGAALPADAPDDAGTAVDGAVPVDAAGPGGEQGIDAGGSGPAGRGGGGAGEPAAGAEDQRTASDQGVTPESIKLGVTLADLDALSRTGVGASNGTVEQRTRAWEAMVAHANERGGAAGRTIELVVEDYNPLDPNDLIQACRRLAEDEQVFAVVSGVGWRPEAALCLTRQYGLPNIGYDAQDLSTFAEAGGLMWTSLASNDRMAYNDAVVLHERELIADRTLGLVSTEGTSEVIAEKVLIPTLERLGYTITHHSKLSQDQSTAQSQIPIEVNQMRSNGVDFIVFYGGPVNSNFWINQAQKQGYRPTYSFSDIVSGSDDFSLQAVDEEVDAYGFGTRRKYVRNAGMPPSESDEACVARVREATGYEMPPDEDMYWEVARYCAQLQAFVDAANGAGVNPTRGSFASVMSNLGQREDLDVGPAGVGGSWLPDKPGGADYLLEQRHDISCRCWVPQGEWFPMRPLGS